jgi:uncharacterized protein YlxW (UPF0749 family)
MNLSPAAWIALICLMGTVVFSAAVLWSAWQGRKSNARNKPAEKSESPSLTRSWQKEDEKLKELAEKVKEIQHKSEK